MFHVLASMRMTDSWHLEYSIRAAFHAATYELFGTYILVMAGCACFNAMNKQWVAHVPFAIKITCLHFIVSFNFSVAKPMYFPWFEIQPDSIASIADLVYDAMFGLYILIRFIK
jgi:hypothetical protein